jgi:hypothetical protein
MRILAVFVVAFGAVFSDSDAKAGDTFTQIGPLNCKCDFVTGKTFCPAVSFPNAFGGVPNVLVIVPGGLAASSADGGGNTAISQGLSATQITPSGFLPALVGVCGGGADFGSNTWYGNWVAIGTPGPVNGTVSPKYVVVLLVAYTPPGTNGGKSSSSVSYAAGSSAGTTTSVSDTFKQSYSIAADSGAGLIGNGGGAGLSFSYSRSVTNDQSIDVKKTTGTTITVPGPPVDGVDHNRDYIYVWLNPLMNLAVTSSSAVWTFAGTDVATIQRLSAGWLVNPSCRQDNDHPSCMPDNVRDDLKQFNVTEADFPDILQRDVLANGGALDPTRFQSLNFTFPYDPPFSPTDPVPTITYTQTSSTTSTVGSKVTDDYKVELTIHGEGSFFDLVKASVKNTDSWEWTYTSSQSTSTGTSEAATVTVGGPAYGYTGPVDMAVYFDSVYKTFAFAPVVNQPIGLRGTLMQASGEPMVGAEVSVVANRVLHRTLTNARGEWRFLGVMNGPCEVRGGRASTMVNECATHESIILRSQS